MPMVKDVVLISKLRVYKQGLLLSIEARPKSSSKRLFCTLQGSSEVAQNVCVTIIKYIDKVLPRAL